MYCTLCSVKVNFVLRLCFEFQCHMHFNVSTSQNIFVSFSQEVTARGKLVNSLRIETSQINQLLHISLLK